MNTDRYRFKLGDFECLAIRDTAPARGNAEMMFPNVSHSNLRIENIDPDLIPYDRICLAVNTGADWVLLDTGLGFMKEGSKLAQILAEENIEPGHIILTHLDGDHYGGLVNRDKRPAFPNANVHICREAWKDFTANEAHLLPIKAQVTPVECEGEVLPGFSMIPFPGHREYHFGIAVESKDEKLLFAADTVCHPLHVKHLDWHCGADTDHELARETRIKFAEMTSASGCLVLAFHFEFPGLGHVIQDGDGWQWQPLAL